MALAGLLGCGSTSAPGDGGQRDSAIHTGSDVRPVDVTSPPDSQLQCGGTTRNLTATQGDLLFVIDRSGSMADNGSDGMPKWTELQGSLATVLPAIQSRIAMGLEVFPLLGSTMDSACSATPRVDVDIMLGGAAAIENIIQTSAPGGHTPTYAALDVAATYFRSIPDATGTHYIVLATDGAPNCNAALDANTCVCSTGTGTRGCAATSCLDDARTIAKIAELAARGIHTFVVGLPGAEQFASVLNQMAVAGGRPQAGNPQYYNPTSRDTLTRTLESITSGLVDCRFRLDAPPEDHTLVDVRLDGTSLPYDPTHQNGWDWSDTTYTEVVFYGATCTRVEDPSGGQQLSAAFGCPPPG
ncbi:MAG: vWA domain-containing protein [Deltaproteobacteria bacterium]